MGKCSPDCIANIAKYRQISHVRTMFTPRSTNTTYVITTSCHFLSREQQCMVYIFSIIWLLNYEIPYLMA